MYQVLPPAFALEPYIERYWAVDAVDGPVDLRVEVFVDARADLIFTFGAPYRRQVIGGATEEIGTSNLDAQRWVPLRILQAGLVRLYGVRFKLGGLGVFTSGSLAPLTGRTLPPAEVFGDGAIGLERGLAGAEGLAEAAGLLDAFFLGLLRRDEGRAAFERALAGMQARDGAVEVREIAAETKQSARQLERLFARHLGVAPKGVARVLRFQRALRSLMRDPGHPLADLALACGYFDQSHFIRDFRRMSGGVPRGYRGYFPPEAPTHFAPNVVAFVQDGRRGA